MKKLMCLVAIFACAACSTPKKQQETTSSDVPAAVETAATTTTEAVKETGKKAKKAVKEAAAETTTATASAFGDINGTEKSSVTCTNKGDTRKISVLSVTEGGCGVVYNKAGENKTVAMAKSSMDYCDTVSSKIKTNLEGAGFDCGGGAAAAAPAETGTSSDTQKQ